MDEELLRKGAMALHWEALYRKKNNTPSSHFLAPVHSLDTDFEKHLLEKNIQTGRLLDIGTGTGEQAIFLAQKGFSVTATDISATALIEAQSFAEAAGVKVAFVEDNILRTHLEGPFDLIIDRGCFTLIHNDFKKDYMAAVHKLLAPRGWLFLKADKRKNVDLSSFFMNADFSIDTVVDSVYINLKDKKVPAVFYIAQKNIV